jgi:predicted enzyme related to lactoylglutathione lyase
MGKRRSYEPGTFSWIELATTDPADARRFYGELFSWQGQDNEIPGGGGIYTMARLDGDDVAGITAQPEQQRAAGIPPNWFSYVTVASADDAAARAEELGGTVHAGPFDVGESGRMAVIADPTGAMFGIWEARESIGATRVNDAGCLTANELSTTDVPAATRFYEALFGWRIEEVDTQGGPRYWMIGHDGAAQGRNGGLRELSAEQLEHGASPHWMPYFTVESAEDASNTASEAGGNVIVPPFLIPTGAKLAVLTDPQGAYFAIFEGEVDD